LIDSFNVLCESKTIDFFGSPEKVSVWCAFDYSQQAREVFSQTLNIGEGQIVYNGELEGIALAFEYAATVALSSQEIRILQTTRQPSTGSELPQTSQHRSGNCAASGLPTRSSGKALPSLFTGYQATSMLLEMRRQTALQNWLPKNYPPHTSPAWL
jgi:hypothetical protein